MDRRDWVGIGDSSSWMGGWTPQGTTIQRWAGRLLLRPRREQRNYGMETNTNKNTKTPSAIVHNRNSKTSMIRRGVRSSVQCGCNVLAKF